MTDNYENQSVISKVSRVSHVSMRSFGRSSQFQQNAGLRRRTNGAKKSVHQSVDNNSRNGGRNADPDNDFFGDFPNICEQDSHNKELHHVHFEQDNENTPVKNDRFSKTKKYLT